MNKKLLVLSVAGLLSTGVAHALVPAASSATGSDLVLTVWDKTANSSFSADLGLSNDAFVANTLSANTSALTYSSTGDAAWDNFAASTTATDTIVYSVVASQTSSADSAYGALFTLSPADTLSKITAYKTTGLDNGIATKIGTWDQAVNTLLGNNGATGIVATANTASTTNSAAVGYAGAANYGEKIAGSIGTITSINTAVNSNANFYRITTTANGGPVALSYFTFDMTTGAHGTASLTYGPAAVAAVPLPTAAWMFLSGAMGLLAVKRRKNTAV